MRQSKMARALATLSLGMAFGLYRHYVQLHELQLGREGFLAQESRYFDKITQWHSVGFMLIAGIILTTVAVGLYEILAAAFARAIPPVEVEE